MIDPLYIILLGIALLCFDGFFFGFSTFFLSIIGLSTILSGSINYFYSLTLQENIGFICLFCIIFTATLYKPLKKMTNRPSDLKTISSMLGKTFILEADLEPNKMNVQSVFGTYRKVSSKIGLKAGTEVVIIGDKPGHFLVDSQ